jgi:hypothetical protein
MSQPRIIGNYTGRRQPHSNVTHPRMFARDVLASTYTGVVPAIVDWHTGVTLPMALNSDLGDCTIADVSHAIETWTKFSGGTEVTISDADVLKMYSRVGGYIPGNPNTDQGCVIQDVLNDWRRIGIGTPAHKILAFLSVDHTSLAEMKACCWLFGGVTLGVRLPQSALDQFSAGRPWTYYANANNTIVGGHDVRLLGVDASGVMYEGTWGTIQQVDPSWMVFVEEAWSQASSADWIKNNTSPEGLDVVALNAAFTQLTDQPGPFPVVPTPPVPPVPPVPGVLTPAETAANVALAGAAHQFISSHHWWQSSAGLKQALQDWLKTWQL